VTTNGGAGFAPSAVSQRAKRRERADANPPNNRAARRQRSQASSETVRLLLTKREAAHALGMSVRHFERHVQPRLRCVHSGQLTLYPVRDLERWADEEATLAGRGSKRVP
jgi:hypothetical protein